MDANFFGGGAPDPASDPTGFAQQQQMAALLQKQGQTGQPGQTVNGIYVAPSAAGDVNQLASALAGGYKTQQLADAQRASDILNGASGQNGIQKIGGWVGGLFGGGGS